MRNFETTVGFILSKSGNPTTNTIASVEGYSAVGDGGAADWKHNGVTGQTVSQSPAQLGDALLNDASGNQWALLNTHNDIMALGVDQFAALGSESFKIDSSAYVSTLAGPTLAITNPIDSNPNITWANLTSSGDLTLDGGFFTSVETTQIERKVGRVFLGDAFNLAGNGAVDLGTSWLSGTGVPSYTAINSHFVVTNAKGNYAATFGAKTDNGSGGVAGIGAASVVLNDVAGGRAWGFIAELQHESAASVTNGLEVAAKNKGTNLTYSPYTASFGVFGLRLAGGGDAAFGGSSTNPSTAGIIIIKNDNSWNTGIVFTEDAITGTDGSAGSSTNGTAISMARRHLIRWNSPEGVNTFGAGIVSTVTNTTNSNTQQFIDDGVNWVNSGGKQIVRLQGGASTINYVQIGASTIGAPVTLTAAGDDTNISLRLNPKGTGLIQFGSHAVIGAETVTGFITMKDTGGVTRKLAVIS